MAVGAQVLRAQAWLVASEVVVVVLQMLVAPLSAVEMVDLAAAAEAPLQTLLLPF
jgi:hypothetical protein